LKALDSVGWRAARDGDRSNVTLFRLDRAALPEVRGIPGSGLNRS